MQENSEKRLDFNGLEGENGLMNPKSILIWVFFITFNLTISHSQFVQAGADDNRLDFYWVDVEGGGATLMVTPSGQTLLFDSGNPGGRDSGRIHKMATEVAGVKQIDFLMTSHFHIDHYGGASELAQLMPIKNIVDKGIPKNLIEDRTFQLKIKSYKAIDAKRIQINTGYELQVKQSEKAAHLTIRCVAADQIVDTKPYKPSLLNGPKAPGFIPQKLDPTDNANSVNWIIRLGDFAFFHGGDTSWNVEAQIVSPINPHGEMDVYQVNHHGLDSSNNPVLLAMLSPTVTVMNNGHRKGCGPKTFKTLVNTRSIKAMYQVRKNLRGDIENNTADEFIANLGQTSDENVMKLSVAPNGDSYTMSIPARNHFKTYLSKPKPTE